MKNQLNQFLTLADRLTDFNPLNRGGFLKKNIFASLPRQNRLWSPQIGAKF